MSVFIRNQLERTQSKLQSVEAENSSMREQLGCMIGSVEELTSEKNQLQEDMEKTETDLKKKLEVSLAVKEMLHLHTPDRHRRQETRNRNIRTIKV